MSTELIERPQFEQGENGTGGGMIEVATSRAAQEVQAAMIVAKKCPRDETAAFERVMRACRRRSLAEQSAYSYERGGTTVTGPSIRMAEVLAQAWGNIDFGITELEQKQGESVVMSYAWDLETNTRQTKVFTVKHERHTKRGKYLLDDPRDIYEMVANQGARRLRACILGVIPGDVVDAAMSECEKTLRGNNSEPLGDRVRKMVVGFSGLGVTQDMIEKRIGHKVGTITEHELAQLRKVFTALKDNVAGVDDYFARGDAPPPPPPSGKTKSDDLADQLKKKAAEPPQAAEEPAEAPETPQWPSEEPEATQEPSEEPEPTPAEDDSQETLADRLAREIRECTSYQKALGIQQTVVASNKKLTGEEFAELQKAAKAKTAELKPAGKK